MGFDLISAEKTSLVQEYKALHNTGLHSLHPLIIDLYYSHRTNQWNRVETVNGEGLVIGPMRGTYYAYVPGPDIPERFHSLPIKCHSNKRVIFGEDLGSYEEVVYPFADINRREKYTSKKSFYNATRAPGSYARKHGLELSIRQDNSSIDLPELIDLYDKWTEQKVQRGVHRISFPVSRYKRVFSKVTLLPYLKTIEARIDGNLVAFRTVLLDTNTAFDLVFVQDYDCPNGLSNAFNYLSLMRLWQQCDYDINWFNCGVSDGDLKAFKQQFPNYVVSCYRVRR